MISSLLIYSIKSAFVLTLLYVPYTLILRKETFFRLNRIVLLAILVLSMVLPLCNVSQLVGNEQPVTQVVHQQVEAVSKPAAEKMEVTTPVPMEIREEVAPDAPYDSSWSWYTILSVLCFVGMLLVLLFRVGQFIRMGVLMRQGCVWKEEKDGVTIYCHADDVTPCSWMRSIVISKKDYDEQRQEILLHEQGHILHHHSFDILLLTLVQMIQWWNPLAYLFGLSLRDVHEYEADHHVLLQGISFSQYANLLIRKAVGISSLSVANNFNHSLVKRRVTMMRQRPSSLWKYGKVLYILPLVLVALSAFATPKVMEPVRNLVGKHFDAHHDEMTPLPPQLNGKMWRGAHCYHNSNLYVRDVIFCEDKTVLHILSDNHHDSIVIREDAYITDADGNKYKFLSAICLNDGFYPFEPVPEGTNVLNFYNGLNDYANIYDIRETCPQHDALSQLLNIQ